MAGLERARSMRMRMHRLFQRDSDVIGGARRPFAEGGPQVAMGSNVVEIAPRQSEDDPIVARPDDCVEAQRVLSLQEHSPCDLKRPRADFADFSKTLPLERPNLHP